MIKLWELGKNIDKLCKDIKPMVGKVNTMNVDLYGLMKEVEKMKYANVELELRLSNLEEMVKALTKKEV